MKKELLREEDGTVRNCDSNIAKVTFFQYIRYFGLPIQVDWLELWNAIRLIIAVLIIILFYPIISVWAFYKYQKRAKHRVERYEKGLL